MTPLNQTVVPLLTADRSNGREREKYRASERSENTRSRSTAAAAAAAVGRLRNYSAVAKKAVAFARESREYARFTRGIRNCYGR